LWQHGQQQRRVEQRGVVEQRRVVERVDRHGRHGPVRRRERAGYPLRHLHGGTLNSSKWGQYTDGMGSSIAQTSNQLAVFDTGAAGSNAGIYSQGAYSLKGCSATVKVLDAPRIDGLSAFFLLSTKANPAYELSFVQDGVYLNMEIHDPGGLKAANQVDFTKGVQVYWRFREAPDSGGTIHWETSPTGVAWTEVFSYPTASLGFAITQLEVNIGASSSGAPGTTVHYDNFNVVP
jgi:hypothetical protein